MRESDSLRLGKSLLSVEDGRLRKSSSSGADVASFDLGSIKEMRSERIYDWPFPLIMSSAFAAFAYVLFLYVETPLWRWIGVIVCVGLSLFSLNIISSCRVVVETVDGTVSFAGVDPKEDVNAFVLSVNEMLRVRRENSE